MDVNSSLQAGFKNGQQGRPENGMVGWRLMLCSTPWPDLGLLEDYDVQVSQLHSIERGGNCRV